MHVHNELDEPHKLNQVEELCDFNETNELNAEPAEVNNLINEYSQLNEGVDTSLKKVCNFLSHCPNHSYIEYPLILGSM